MGTETALVLSWTAAPQTPVAPGQGGATFEIFRAEVDPATAQAAITNPSEAKLVAPPVLLAQATEPEYRDSGFQFGHTYLYTVREVEQLGNEAVESADSAPAIIMAKDVFPPAPPQGVEAVAVPGANGAPAAIELTWTISTETDLAGYNVYRSDQAETPGQKLNSELLLTPTFRDMSVLPGQAYFYRVGAVDQSGNESSLSSAVKAQAPEP
jgi:predicted phage tail protein